MEGRDDLEAVNVDCVQDDGRESESPDDAENNPAELAVEKRETNRKICSGDHEHDVYVVDDAEDLFPF